MKMVTDIIHLSHGFNRNAPTNAWLPRLCLCAWEKSTFTAIAVRAIGVSDLFGHWNEGGGHAALTCRAGARMSYKRHVRSRLWQRPAAAAPSRLFGLFNQKAHLAHMRMAPPPSQPRYLGNSIAYVAPKKWLQFVCLPSLASHTHQVAECKTSYRGFMFICGVSSLE